MYNGGIMKRKLILPIITSILSLIVTLVTVSYAWFSMNQHVSVDTITVSVAGVEGMRLSADGENWSTSISAEDIIEAGGLIPSKFIPISSCGLTNSTGLLSFYDVNYNVDDDGGRPKMTSSITSINAQTLDGVISGWDNEEEGYYLVFDLYIETTNPQRLILNAGTSVSSNADNGYGSQLIARVAFVNFGTITTSEYETSNGTDLTSLTGEGIQAVIFEPNAQWHSSQAIYQGLSSDDGTIDDTYVISGLDNKIPAVPLTSEDDAYINSTASCLKLADTISYAGVSVTQEIDKIDVLVEADTNNVIANLDEGYSKIRIFMWLEGQDGDCVNQVTGSNVTFSIKLTTIELLG